MEAVDSHETATPHHPRSSKACLQCRAAKVRCLSNDRGGAKEGLRNLMIPGNCQRCVELGVLCQYTPSRRGRVKGSINSRTRERLLLNGSADTRIVKRQSKQSPPGCSGVPGATAVSRSQDGRSAAFALPLGEYTHWKESRHFMNAINELDRSPVGDLVGLSPDGKREEKSGLLERLRKEFPVGPSDRQEPESHPVVSVANEVQDVNIDPRKSIANFLSDMDGRPQTTQEQALLPSKLHGHQERTGDRARGDPQARPSGVSDRSNLKQSAKLMKLPAIDYTFPESELWSMWSSEELKNIIREQSGYFRYGVHGFKRDIAPGLDPVQQGLITAERAAVLFQAYFTYVQPQWAVLDPDLHTVDFVASRSALLMSTILAVGSTALATAPDNGCLTSCDAEAIALHSHIAKVDLIVHMSGARSIEILQAEIILSRYMLSPTAQLDEVRWDRAARIATIAYEIGLNLPHRSPSTPGDPMQWNDLPVKAFLIINEWRISAFSGVPTVDISHFELKWTELEEINRQLPNTSFAIVPAFYSLVLITREARRRLTITNTQVDRSLILESEFQWIESSINSWINKWCSTDRRATWHLRHEALCSHFQLLIYLIGVAAEFVPREQQETYRRRLLVLSTQIFECALEHPEHTHMTHRAGLLPCVAAIILNWSDRRDSVLRLALRMAGPPGRNRPYTFVRSAGHQMLAMMSIQHIKDGASVQGQSVSSGAEAGMDHFRLSSPPKVPQTYTNPLDITFNSAFDFTLPYTTNPSLAPTNPWTLTDLRTATGTNELLFSQAGSVPGYPWMDLQAQPQSGDFELESFLQMTSAFSSNEDTLKGILTMGGGGSNATELDGTTPTMTNAYNLGAYVYDSMP